jgi:hypothetical protein
VEFATEVSIDWEETTRGDVEVNGGLSYFAVNGQAAVSGSYEKAKSAKLRLAKFIIPEGKLKAMLNKDARVVRNYLADEGKDGRIVSQVWVVMEAELAEHFDRYGSTSLSVKAAGKNLKVTATGGKQGSQTITLSPDTTFAYALSKVKKWNKGKT